MHARKALPKARVNSQQAAVGEALNVGKNKKSRKVAAQAQTWDTRGEISGKAKFSFSKNNIPNNQGNVKKGFRLPAKAGKTARDIKFTLLEKLDRAGQEKFYR